MSQQDLINRAIVLRTLARGFAYPDRMFQETLVNGAYRDELSLMLPMLTEESPWVALMDSLEEISRETQVLEQEYTYLFARNVLSPPNETSYGVDKTFQRVWELSDIASFYAAFGFQAVPGQELPDHIGVELEFLAVLYAKEAYALEQGSLEKVKLCAEIRERFLHEHVGRWLPLFVQRLEERGRLRFYPALAQAVNVILSAENAYAQAKLLE